MQRRTVLAAGIAALGAPRLAASQGQRALRFVPAADIAALDPVWTTASQTRDHAMMVYDQLYGVNDALQPLPQMAAGHVVENEGRVWRITLRPGLASPASGAGGCATPSARRCWPRRMSSRRRMTPPSCSA
jgi:peptide/nickel transport system substrate-binding protein